MKTKLLLFLGCCVLSLFAQAQQPGPGERDYRILHVNKKFTPGKGFRVDNNTIRSNSANTRVFFVRNDYFLVQFDQLPTENQRAALKGLGITLLDYFPNLAYYAHFKKEVSADQLSGLGVRTILPVDEGLKLSPGLFDGKIPAYAKKGDNVEVQVILYTGADAVAAEKNILRHATIIDRTSPVQWKILVPQNKLSSLVNVKEIKFIEPVSDAPMPEKEVAEPGKEDIFSNDFGRSNYVNSGFGGVLFNGDGVNVMVRENGMYKGPDLQGRVMDGTNQPGDPSSHPSGVASYLGGAGNINPRDRSNAWGANILAISGQNTYTLYDDPVKKIRVTNMSYGWWNTDNRTVTAGYNSTSQEHDNFERTRPEAMLVYSSGNVGDYTTLGGKYNGMAGWGNISGEAKNAKNILTISGTDYEDNFLDWTCKGPAYDGRIVPQLAIEGQGGTSFAAPKISGIFAILSQAYKTELQAPVPAALIKAVMMNTADDVYNPGIDFKSGFGRPNVRRAYLAIKNRRFAADSIAQGSRKSFPVVVPAGTAQLRVMVYWTDYEATPGAAQALVNDLDLTVNDPSGGTTLPWGLDTTANAVNLNALPTRKTDHINNEEQVTIDNPAAGTYNVFVDGFNVPQGPQEFFVVYEFIKDEVLLSYPLGGESMAPGQQEYIRWDAFGTPGNFDLEYSSNNGVSWDTIATNIAAAKRQFKWNVPNLAANILIRVKRGAQSNVSAAVHVMPVPTGFKTDWVCDNALQLSWNKVPATGVHYEIFKLGEKYMDSIGTTTDTIFNVSAPDASKEEWYAVRAVGTNGEAGLRCNAIRKDVGLFKCNSVITGVAFNVRKDSVLLTGSVNALGKTLSAVTFEYGPTTAYGSVFTIPGTFTGTSFTPLQQWVPIGIQSGETWHYRLKGKLDGIDAFGDDHSFQPAPGNSMKFNGAETMTLGTNDAVNGNKPRTIECWVKTSVYNSDGGAITLAGGTGTTLGDFTLATNGGDNGWKLSLWNVTRTYTLPNNKGEWHHMALTYNPANTTAELYYDGTLWDSWSTGGALTTLPGNIRLGVRVNGSSFYYNGEMDEVRIWNTVRTAAQIRENMHHPLRGNETGLVYYVNFDNMEPETYEVKGKTALSQTGSLQKVKAGYPFGTGATYVSTEAAGNIVFGNGADVTAFYNAQDGKPASFSKIDLTSAIFSGFSPSAFRVGGEFWIGHRYAATAGAVNMNLTLKTSAGINTGDVVNPGKILVFTRLPYTDGKWQYSGAAGAADSIANTVTINNQTSYQQYLLMKDDQPFMYGSADSLTLADVRAGVVTRPQQFTLSGANLPSTVSITAPGGFEISVNDTAYVNSTAALNITTTGGTLQQAKVFVRFVPDTAGIYQGNIRISAGATVLDSVALKQEAVPVEVTAGKAMNFDGNGDYLEVQNLNWQPTEFTIEWWLKPRSFKNYNQSIGNGWGAFLAHADSGGGLNIGVANNTNSRLLVPAAYVDLNAWHHYAYTFKNGAAKIYRDGKLIDSKTASSYPPNWTTFRIGANSADAIDGELDEFRMWTVEKTQQQIREGMHLTATGTEAGLKLCLQFQASQNGVVDISGNGYPVRLVNAVRTTSNAPIAKGVSETKQILSPGVTRFGQTGISLDFSATGTHPNGEVVVSKLNAVPANDLLPAAQDSTYWVINNYGSNAVFTGLTKLSISSGAGASGAGMYRLYRRGFNAFGNNWALNGKTVAATDSNVVFSFNAVDSLTSFGQFAFNKTTGIEQVDTLAGQAYKFDGSDAGIVVNGLNWKPVVFTIEWWLKANNAQSWNQQIGNGWGSFLAHANDDKSMSVGVANNAASRVEIPGAFSDLNTWHHYAFSFDNGVVNVYRDGQLVGTRTASSFPATWSGFTVNNTGGDGINGSLDEFRIWSTARTQSQIRENMYHTVDAGTAGLKVYLQGQGQPGAAFFTEVSGNAYIVAADSSVQHEASAAPVARGQSQSLTIDSAGRYHFDQVGLALKYQPGGGYPKGEAVVSRLNATPYAAPAGDVYHGQYWIIRSYGDSAATAVSTIALTNAVDSLHNLQLSNRAFNASGNWGVTANGATTEGNPDVAMGTAATDIRNKQLVFMQTSNAAPAFTAPANITVVRNDTCGYNAAPNVTGVPTAVQDDTDSLPVISYTDMMANGSCAANLVITRSWAARDNAGRWTRHAQTITVKDTTAPLINCKANAVRQVNSGGCTYTAAGTELDITASDHCSAVNFSYSLSGATTGNGVASLAGVAFHTGVTNVSWTATDACGNTGNCSYTLTVNNAQLSVTIPDAYAVKPGGEANTIYLGYGPSSLKLTTQVTGGKSPYTYKWSTGATAATAQVSPSSAGTYTYSVTITDANGCTAFVSKQVTVTDIRGGYQKVIICHKTGSGSSFTLNVNKTEVPTHLAHGDRLGACVAGATKLAAENDFRVIVSPNPSTQRFTLQLPAYGEGIAAVKVYDLNGRLVEEVRGTDKTIIFGERLMPGTYMVEVVQGKNRETITVIKM
ncbi:LamG-like jellyroll fold domain-containing protein [Chitinophaga sp. 22321]|uniref:S8 family serine peptidase n=1 Tax=Chitinophaga hostae TaxID=2831022 RepID=A0ABS5J8I6_9BACT|nr:LamG-like jellyroll fold domain-containing protein [Chitinophaga hostae]MBS0030732.1 S8 family serine peptidase [Chitinophaga hostae]